MQAFIWRESERHEKVGGAVSCFRVRAFSIHQTRLSRSLEQATCWPVQIENKRRLQCIIGMSIASNPMKTECFGLACEQASLGFSLPSTTESS